MTQQHISFASRREEPVYIGFDEPTPNNNTKKKKCCCNGWGAASLFFGILGLLGSAAVVPFLIQSAYTSGYIDKPAFGVAYIVPFFAMFLSVLAIVFGSVGVLRSPRRFAIAGMLMGMLPVAVAFGWHHRTMDAMESQQRETTLKFETRYTVQQISKAVEAIDEAQKTSESEFTGLDGNRIAIQFLDGWKTELRYEPSDTGYRIRSAGPDGEFATKDDIRSKSRGWIVSRSR